MPLKIVGQTPTPPVKHVIGIAAGKGGVGKSTVTVNLARALKLQGFSVGILDADVYGPSLRKMLHEEQLPAQKGAEILPAICEGMPVISMAFFRQQKQGLVARGPIANGVITQFLTEVLWGPLDYLLIDFPPGTGDVQLTLSQKAQLTGVVIVTTPQEVAALDVWKTMDLFDQVQIPILGVVENMSYYLHGQEKLHLFGKGGGERLAKEGGVPYFGEIPIDPELSASGDRGESPMGLKPFHHLAKRVVEEVATLRESAPLVAVDKDTLVITWKEGERRFRFSELQKRCPCAQCSVKPPVVQEDVTAEKIARVGRYAIRIHFSSGCSRGLFHFDFLKGTLRKV